MIKKCTCIHEFQDKRYGAQMRVHNKMKNGDFRCTVCGDVKKGSGALKQEVRPEKEG